MAKAKAVPDVRETVDNKMVTVIFRENRKYDLHIGRKMITFKARESKQIPKSWVDHPDFNNVRQYFIVKGV